MSINTLLKKIRQISTIEVVVVLAVVVGVVGVVKYFGRNPETRLVKIQMVGKDWTNNPAAYNSYRPPFWLAEKLNLGDVEYDASGRVLAKVVGLEKYERLGSEFDVYLILEIRSLTNNKDRAFVFKGQRIEVGGRLSLVIDNSVVVGQVVDDNYPSEGYKKYQVLVEVQKRAVEEEEASIIKEGDKMLDWGSEKTIAEVVDVEVKPSLTQVVTETDGGGLQISHDPSLKDVRLLLKLTAENHEGGMIFAGHQKIKPGNPLWLYLDGVDLLETQILSVKDEWDGQ